MSPVPPGGKRGSAFPGFSATIAPGVMSAPAIDAESWSAIRAALAGSMMPAFTRSRLRSSRALAPVLILPGEQFADGDGAIPRRFRRSAGSALGTRGSKE